LFSPEGVKNASKKKVGREFLLFAKQRGGGGGEFMKTKVKRKKTARLA
jgi:hypothetical protein